MGQVEIDAERYRYLRSQHWSESEMCVVVGPKQNVRLGSFCPSEQLLDEAVDAAIRIAKLFAGKGTTDL